MSYEIDMLPISASVAEVLEMRREVERQIAEMFAGGGRRSGKSVVQAAIAAEQLKAGDEVYLARHSTVGDILVERVVGVPGHDDGRQITDKSRNSD